MDIDRELADAEAALAQNTKAHLPFHTKTATGERLRARIRFLKSKKFRKDQQFRDQVDALGIKSKTADAGDVGIHMPAEFYEAANVGIRCAAINYNGSTGEGRDHMAAWRDLRDQGAVSESEYPLFWKVRVSPAAGFITTDNRFVSRVEALDIARAAGQLKPSQRATRHEVEGLDSADLDIPGSLSKPDAILLGVGRGPKVDLRTGHHPMRDRFSRGLPYESAEKIVARLLD